MDAAKRELIEKWKEKAEHDFVTASVIAAQLPHYKDIVGFHCQAVSREVYKSGISVLRFAVFAYT